MYGADTKREIFVIDTLEASILNHFLEFMLLWKFSNTLYEVFVGIPIIG